MPITKWKNDRSNARLTRGVFSKAEPELLIVSIESAPSQLSMAEENGDMTFELLLTSKIRPTSSMQSSAQIPDPFIRRPISTRPDGIASIHPVPFP